MTEQEIAQLGKENFWNLQNIDRKLITKKVIDEMEVYPSNRYFRALEGVNPECISKIKALQLLKYDKEIYGLLTKELQEDKDVLEITTEDLTKLPKALFNNKTGINYVLDKWNVEGKSWAVFKENNKGLVIKKNIKICKYIIYSEYLKHLDGTKDYTDDMNKIIKQYPDSYKKNHLLFETFSISNIVNLGGFAVTSDIKHLD